MSVPAQNSTFSTISPGKIEQQAQRTPGYFFGIVPLDYTRHSTVPTLLPRQPERTIENTNTILPSAYQSFEFVQRSQAPGQTSQPAQPVSLNELQRNILIKEYEDEIARYASLKQKQQELEESKQRSEKD